MKKLIIIISVITLISCERVGDYQCVCYKNVGSDSTSYELYNVKNKKTMAESYCKSLSMPDRPCDMVK